MAGEGSARVAGEGPALVTGERSILDECSGKGEVSSKDYVLQTGKAFVQVTKEGSVLSYW